MTSVVTPMFYTLDEVAAMLNCSAKTVRRQVSAGVVTPMRVGAAPNGPMRFRQQDVDQIVKAMTPIPVERRRRKRAVR